jgi:hypothetical protein
MPTECQSGSCTDGVCCDQACAGACTYCNFPASPGACLPVPDGADPRRFCQAAAGGSQACAGACQGGQCAFPDVAAAGNAGSWTDLHKVRQSDIMTNTGLMIHNDMTAEDSPC